MKLSDIEFIDYKAFTIAYLAMQNAYGHVNYEQFGKYCGCSKSTIYNIIRKNRDTTKAQLYMIIYAYFNDILTWNWHENIPLENEDYRIEQFYTFYNLFKKNDVRELKDYTDILESIYSFGVK